MVILGTSMLASYYEMNMPCTILCTYSTLFSFPHKWNSGVGVALLQASQPEFKLYARDVVTNAQAMAEELMKRGYTISSGEF